MSLPTVLPLTALPAHLPAEHTQLLASGTQFRLEHILSAGHASAEGFWYEQAEDEWAVLLAGNATLAFEEGTVAMVAGDALLIPAGCRHRVATSSHAVWLALHFS